MKGNEEDYRIFCKELLTEKKKLEAIMDSIADGVFTVDTE